MDLNIRPFKKYKEKIKKIFHKKVDKFPKRLYDRLYGLQGTVRRNNIAGN